VIVVLFLGGLTWMINDVRLEIRKSAKLVQATGQSVNERLPTVVKKVEKSADVISEHLPEIVEQLPTILEKVQKSADTVSEQLPEIVEKIRMSTVTLAELAEDIRQLKELAGVSSTARDKSLVAYADSVLDLIEGSGGVIGLKKTFSGNGLKSALPAKEWTVGARKEALYLTVVAKSKRELVTRLVENKFGSAWYLQLEGQQPVPLFEWLKANHAPTNDL